MSKRNKHIKEIALEYGFHEQSRQCMEEMAELTIALNKLHRYEEDSLRGYETDVYCEPLYQNVTEEMADVIIMIMQMQYLLEIDDEDLEAVINKKVKRQIKRIKKRRKERDYV